MMRTLLWVIFCVFWAFSQAQALNFMGDWRYVDSSEAQSIFSQMYSLSLSSRPTNTISAGSTLRYNRNEQGGESQELFSPVAYLSLRNDFFNFNFSLADTERRSSQGPDYSSTSWNADLSSSYKDIANMRLYYGSSSQHDDSNPRNIDSTSNYWGFNLGKDWKGLDFNYDYRGGHNEDYVNKSQTDTFSHFVRGDYAGHWRKLSYSFGQQFNYMKTEWEGELQGGTASYQINIGVEWKPPISNYTDFNDYIDLVYDKKPEQDYGIIIDLGNEEIGRLEFYYDSVEWKEIPSDVKWDIYSSRDKINWSPLANNVKLPHEFSTASSLNFSDARYLKLIPRTKYSQTLPLNNPLFKAYKYVTTSKYTREARTYRTNISLGYDFTDHISVSYYFSSDRSEPTPGPDAKNTIHTLSGSWWVNQYFQPRASLSYSKDERESQPDMVVKSFSSSVYSEILPTLNMSFGYTHSLSEEGGVKMSRTDALSWNTSANLYPDLDMRLDFTYTNAYSYSTDVTTTGFTSNLNTTARIRPTLTLNAVYQYSYSKSSNNSSNTSNYLLFDLNWTISNFCSAHAMESVSFSENETTVNSSYSIWLALTPKTQINFQYSGTRNNTKTDQFSSFFSWRINRHFSFRTNYSWSKNDDKTNWSWMANLTAVF